MEFFTRVLSGNSRIKERTREAQQINEAFKTSLDDLKELVESEGRDDVTILLDNVYESSFPEEQIFMKRPSQARLKSQKELVSRLLMGLDALGVPTMADMLAYVKNHGMEGISQSLVTLLELLSPLLDGKQAPEFSTDDVLDAMDSEWHSTSGIGSPLLNVIASATSSPRLSAASLGDSPFPSHVSGSPFRRVVSDRSMFLSRAHELGAKTVLDKTSSTKTSTQPTLTASVSSQFPSSYPAYSTDELMSNIPPITLPPVEENPSRPSSQDGSPKQGLQKKHRRKSSSLRQLFAEDATEELSEGSGGSSKLYSRNSSRRRNSAEFSKLALDASEPSSPFLSRRGSTEVPDNDRQLNVEDEHMETSWPRKMSSSMLSVPLPDKVPPVWTTDAGGFLVDSSMDDNNAQNQDRTTEPVGDTGNGNISLIGAPVVLESAPILDNRVDSLSNFEVEDSEEVGIVKNSNISCNDNLESKQADTEYGSNDDDKEEYDACEPVNHDKSPETTPPLQENRENIVDCGNHTSAAIGESASLQAMFVHNSDSPIIEESILPLQDNGEILAGYGDIPSIDDSTHPQLENMDNVAADGVAPTCIADTNMENSSISNDADPHSYLENSAAMINASTIDGATLPLQGSIMELESAALNENTLPPQEEKERVALSTGESTPSCQEIMEKNFASSNATTIDESTLPHEKMMENAATRPCQEIMEKTFASSNATTIDESSLPHEKTMENAAAQSKLAPTIEVNDLCLQDNMQNSDLSKGPTIDELHKYAMDAPSDEFVDMEHNNIVLQHRSHQRSRSDSTPARSPFKSESMVEEELNGSQSDRISSAERLRSSFADRLKSVAASMESFAMQQGRGGLSPARVVQVAQQKTMPWMQSMNDNCFAGEEEKMEPASSSDPDTASSTSSASSSGPYGNDRQEPEIETGSENNDGEAPALSPHHSSEEEEEREKKDAGNAQQEGDLNHHWNFGFQGILAPLLLPSSGDEPDVHADLVHENRSDKDLANVNKLDEAPLLSSRMDDSMSGSQDESEDDSTHFTPNKYTDGNVVEADDSSRVYQASTHSIPINHTDGAGGDMGKTDDSTPVSQASHLQIPAAVTCPSQETSGDVAIINVIASPHVEHGDSVSIHILKHQDNNITDVPYAKDDDSSFDIHREEISGANSSGPLDEDDKVDLYLSTQVLPKSDPNSDGLRTNILHEKLDCNDAPQTPNHESSPAISSLAEDENGSNEGGDGQFLMRKAMEIREQGDDPEHEKYSLPADRSFPKMVINPTVFRETDENGNVVPRKDLEHSVSFNSHEAQQQQPYPELEEHLKCSDSQFEQLLSELNATEEEDPPLHPPGLVSGNSNINAQQINDHGDMKRSELFEGEVATSDTNAQQIHGHDDMERSILSELEFATSDINAQQVHDHDDMERRKLSKGEVAIGPDIHKLQSPVEDVSLEDKSQNSDSKDLRLNDEMLLSDEGNLKLDDAEDTGWIKGVKQSDDRDMDSGIQSFESDNVRDPKLGSETIQPCTTGSGLENETMQFDGSVERDFVYREGQFIVGGPGPIAVQCDHESQGEPEASYKLISDPQDDSSSSLERLQSSRVVYQGNVDSTGIHAHCSESQIVASSGDHQKSMEADSSLAFDKVDGASSASHKKSKETPSFMACESVDGNVDDKNQIFVEGVFQEEQISPPCWEASDAEDAMNTHPLQVDANVQRISVVPQTADKHAQMQETASFDPPKNGSRACEQASLEDHVDRTWGDHLLLDVSHPSDMINVNHVEECERSFNEPAPILHDPHMDRWELDTKVEEPKRKGSYIRKLARDCVSCCRHPHAES